VNGKRGFDCRKTNQNGQKPGVGIVFPIHLQSNEQLTRFFGARMGRLARDMRHFCAHHGCDFLAANGCQSCGEAEDEDDWECCRGVDSQLHLYSTTNRVNSMQTKRGAGMDGLEWVWRTVLGTVWRTVWRRCLSFLHAHAIALYWNSAPRLKQHPPGILAIAENAQVVPRKHRVRFGI